jgi:hypothetical protein
MRADRQMAAFQEWMGRQIQLHLVAPSDDKNGAG